MRASNMIHDPIKIANMSDAELKAAVMRLTLQGRSPSDLRKVTKPYLDEVKKRITQRTGHKFKS